MSRQPIAALCHVGAVGVVLAALAFDGAALVSFAQADGLSTADRIAGWIELPIVLSLVATLACMVAILLWRAASR